MNKGLVDLAELRKNISKADYEGKSSYCFKDGNRIIKVYARKEDKGFFIPPDVNKICDFSNFSAETIVFPEEYIYEDRRIAGEIIKYANGKRLDYAINDKVDIKSMLKSYDAVLNDLYLYNNIDMIDLCYVNILYSNKSGFHIIDTTDWKFTDDALKINIHNLNSSIVDMLVPYLLIPCHFNSKNYYVVNSSFLKKLEQYGNSGQRLKNSLIMLSVDRYDFLKIMYSYLEMYRIHYGSEANTLKDVKEFTKVLKKG